jgi:hypothetical protein
MKKLMQAKAVLHDDGQLEVEVTPFVFDERQTRQLANAMAELIMQMLGEDIPSKFALSPDEVTTH